MKFLLHGNAPRAKTGYGVQIGHLARMLKADGHEVAVSATYGIQGGADYADGFLTYGCGFDSQSNDLIHQHAHHWFNGDPGWIITCVDVWGIENPLQGFNVAAWTPVDHFTAVGVQPNVAQFFQRCPQAVPIAMSRFGHDMLTRSGLDPLFVPLSVDTSVFKPTDKVSSPVLGEMTGRQLLGVPDDAFVVGMVAMNKGWARDRKGFNEAFWAFGVFNHEHPEANAYLYLHSEKLGGAEGINLVELAIHAGIPEHKIKWAGGPSQYGYRLGYTDEMMAASYTAMDVLLAPSHGEGFCVPIIEAQACGTPVIATNFSAQAELVPEGTGWLIEGQPEWDPAHHAIYKTPLIPEVVAGLELAYESDLGAMAESCIEFASTYDTARVYDTFWRSVIAELIAEPVVLPLEREPMPDEDAVAVLIPIEGRTEHVVPLIEAFERDLSGAHLYFIVGHDDFAEVERLLEERALRWPIVRVDSGTSCAHKWNVGFNLTTEPWVLCTGDDVRPHPGWLDAARGLSDRFDVIGTNDTAGKVKNPKVANGSHADHFFVRRAYVEEYGASLEGPGVLASEEYRHWFVDKEIIDLAKARGVFSPCLDSIVEHLHPGYDGDEAARAADPTYMQAVESAQDDQDTFRDRVALIEQQRTGRAR